MEEEDSGMYRIYGYSRSIHPPSRLIGRYVTIRRYKVISLDCSAIADFFPARISSLSNNIIGKRGVNILVVYDRSIYTVYRGDGA